MIEKEKHQDYLIPLFSKLILSYYEQAYITHVKDILDKWKRKYYIKNGEDFHNAKEQIGICEEWEKLLFKKSFKEPDKKFQKFLYNRILDSEQAQKMDGKSHYVIRRIFKAYLINPHQLPDTAIINIYCNLCDIETVMERGKTKSMVVGKYRNQLKDDLIRTASYKFQANLVRSIIDYIAGMSDDFPLYQYEVLYGSTKPNSY